MLDVNILYYTADTNQQPGTNEHQHSKCEQDVRCPNAVITRVIDAALTHITYIYRHCCRLCSLVQYSP